MDENSSRHPYLFKAKSLKLFNQVLILLMNATLGSTRTHFISWYCRYYKKEINVLQLQSSQDTKSCFLGWRKTKTAPSGLGFELPIRVSVSRKSLSIALSVTRIMCVLYFSFIVQQYPSSLNITFSLPKLS